ncbi:heavy metal-associated domain-containing protein [Succinatimonas hippei]|uniref:heavy-metal-associated domain-containing protein n=1 Tax=Succinatimonas hippei TaxID=626938 RepID=UPI0025E34D80|nr:heavy metal-associated domain-containing protein [Succinatimonas hippei]
MKLRCDIKGLDCPHCALSLEKKIAALDGIKNANINFPLQSLVIEANDDLDEDELIEKVQKVSDDFEDGISVTLRD